MAAPSPAILSPPAPEETRAGRKSERTALLLLAAIMVGGLLLRLFFFTGSLPVGGAPLIRDEGNYVGIAVPLSQGQGFVDRWVWTRPPAYPLFVAGFLLLSGGSLPVAALAQILLSVANIGLVYALALEVFRWREGVPGGRARSVGLAAAGLMALNPHAAFYANLLMPETLYMLAITAMGWALVRAVRMWRMAAAEDGQAPRSVLALIGAAGLIAGLGALLRSLLLTFVPLIAAWLWWVPAKGSRGWWSRSTLVAAGLFIVVVLATIAPWTVRNYIRYERFLPVDTVGQYQLWLYNGEEGIEEVKQRLEAIPNQADRGSYALEQGLRAIMANPERFAGEAVVRFAESWPVDHFSEFRAFVRDKYPGTDCTNLDLFAWAGSGFYVAFGVLAIWGVAFAPGRGFKGLFLLVALHYGVTTMFAHAEFRYRMPLYPFASVYAGWALVGLFGWIRHRGWRSRGEGAQRWALGLAGLLSIVFVAQSLFYLLPGLPNSFRYERRYLAGKSALERGDFQAALAEFTGAAQIDRACACLYRNIGLAHGGLEQRDQERSAYETALAREEHDWRTRALLSDRLRAAGDPRAANPVAFTRPEFRSAQQVWAWEHLPPPQGPVVDVGGADIGYVMGFEAAETEPLPEGGEVSYRWSSGHASVRLAVPSGEGKVRLGVRWHSLAWAGKPEPDATVRVVVNRHEVGELVARPAWEEAVLDLPLLGNAGPIVIELFAPAERPPGGETRMLGVAVDEVWLVRSGESGGGSQESGVGSWFFKADIWPLRN